MSPQCVVAAAITDAALNFREAVRTGTLTPDVAGLSLTPSLPG